MSAPPGLGGGGTDLDRRRRLKGAVFADVYGWERAKWFDEARAGERYSFRRSNAFGISFAKRIGIFRHGFGHAVGHQ